jgi:hypothetical protein
VTQIQKLDAHAVVSEIMCTKTFMADPLNIGKTKNGKTLYFLSLSRLNEWPSELRVDSKYIRLFIACDARRVRAAAVRDFSSLAIQQGVVDLSVWGPNCCNGFHIPFVESLIVGTPNPKDDLSDLITANCNQNSLRTSIEFFVMFGSASKKFRRSCKSLLFVAVGNSAWANSMQRSLRELKNEIVEA